ncbi:MAG TPA: hypothetical protein VGH91_04450 [Gammaproteobacteria bacterium]|jgi:hypothetical protein
MFEAYKVGIRLSLVSNVATGLAAMSRQFTATGAQAKALQVELGRIRALALTGGAVTGLGLFGLGMMDKALKPAEAYAHQLNVMNMAGLKQVDIANAVGAAWKTSHEAMTTTATENLKTFMDLRAVLGDASHATAVMPIVAKLSAVLAASGDTKISGSAQDLAFSVAKALDVKGSAIDPGQFTSGAEQIAKVISAFQSRVTPEQYLSVVRYARQAKFGLSDEFMYQLLPTLMLENASKGGGGGGSRGVGPMLAAFYRLTNQGFVNKKSIPLLEQLGLIAPGSSMSTTTTGSMVNALRGHELAASNPFAWVQTVLLPAIHHAYGQNLSRERLQEIINGVFRGNQLGANLALEFALKPQNFLRDQKIIQGAMPLNEAYNSAITQDPGTARRALDAQWENLKVSLMMGLVPILIPLLTKLANVFMFIGDILRDHPLLAQSLAVGFTSLFAIMGLVIGPMLLFNASLAALKLALPGVLTSFGGVTSSLSLMGKLGAVVAAGWLGYTVGSIINDYVISPLIQKLTGGKDDSLGSWLYDFTHPNQYDPKAPKPNLKNGLTLTDEHGNAIAQPSAVGPNAGNRTLVLHSNLHIDSKLLAKTVTKHQVRLMGGPNTSSQGMSLDQYLPPDAPSLATP